MSYEVVLTDQAREDLRGIYRYIALTLRSRINADRQLDRIEHEILSLSEMPERYKPVAPDLRLRLEARMLSVDHYCVIYHVNKEDRAVQVLRILYGGRDMEAELQTM